MNTPFSQSKDTYKIFFKTKYRYLDAFDTLPISNLINISYYEVESKTVEAMPDDIWCFEIYLSEEPNLSIIQGQITAFAELHDLAVLNEIKLQKIHDQDWITAYHSQLKPIIINHFFISARAHKELCPQDKIGIFIDAARAFGTGEHNTTAGCIEAMEDLAHLKFYKILDIGTGTGILSFAASYLWLDAEIYGCDSDEVAIEIAKDNAKFNDVNVQFFQNCPEELFPSRVVLPKYDLVIANILATPLIMLSKQIQQISAPAAYLILSGFLDHQLTEIVDTYEKLNFKSVATIYKNSWVILVMQYIP